MTNTPTDGPTTERLRAARDEMVELRWRNKESGLTGAVKHNEEVIYLIDAELARREGMTCDEKGTDMTNIHTDGPTTELADELERVVASKYAFYKERHGVNHAFTKELSRMLDSIWKIKHPEQPT